MDNIFSSGLTALYVGRISLPHRAVKNDKIQRYHNLQEKYYLFKELLYLNKTLTGSPLNHILVHLIIRTIWRVPMGLTVSRKIPIVKPLAQKLTNFNRWL